MTATTPGFIVLYRWRIRPGFEDDFREAWSEGTRGLLKLGSLGSRLHVGDDGIWYSYAQWPSDSARQAAFQQPFMSDESREQMLTAIEENLPEVHLAIEVDELL